MWYILLLVFCLSLNGASALGQLEVQKGELSNLKKNSQIFERIIGEILRQNFDNPFAIAAEPQAAYLPGYGVALSFHLRINRGTIRGFYGEIKNPLAGDARSKAEQLEVVRKAMLQALADYGNTIKELGSKERISICAHVEDRNELDPSRNRTDIILSAAKSDVDLYAMKKISIEEFSQRVEVVEY